ncbi:ornithine cyclodeaminase family protein [Bacillus horti]|uniref:Ornithine cyclodeaminase n=1 Tax=Caldalkalibacillus horti TaxID=77523 RepID=A0ABT9W3S8_9BACI|nr:ornithine cyclodeaminase family protein [Bacillus horti]MDQ0167719.1 ornithine cyclodeaminase [Bacillus horti]
MTLLLSKADTITYLDQIELLLLLEKGFVQQSINNNQLKNEKYRYALDKDNTVIVLFPGLHNDIPAYTVKVHSKTPKSTPAITGIIHLHDINTGELLAIMDSTYITAIRTGLSGALGTHLVADPIFKKVTIIGAGVQGYAQLRALSSLRKIEKVDVLDMDINKANQYASKLSDELHIQMNVVNTLKDALRDTEIIITSTWEKEPFIYRDMIKRGTHITTLGSDELGKSEVSEDLIKSSLFICDNKNLALRMGVLGSLSLNESHVYAELGDVMINPLNHRTRENYYCTVFSSVGMAFQDLAAAWIVYKNAKKALGGQNFNFQE